MSKRSSGNTSPLKKGNDQTEAGPGRNDRDPSPEAGERGRKAGPTFRRVERKSTSPDFGEKRGGYVGGAASLSSLDSAGGEGGGARS